MRHGKARTAQIRVWALMAESGLSNREIARETGWSESSIRRNLTKIGTPKRMPGPRPKHASLFRATRDVMIRRMREMILDGVSSMDVAVELGLCRQTVCKHTKAERAQVAQRAREAKDTEILRLAALYGYGERYRAAERLGTTLQSFEQRLFYARSRRGQQAKGPLGSAWEDAA